jgi:hypothetical protein
MPCIAGIDSVLFDVAVTIHAYVLSSLYNSPNKLRSLVDGFRCRCGSTWGCKRTVTCRNDQQGLSGLKLRKL